MMKLFVWHDVLCDYTPGIIFALAHTVEEARRIVMECMPTCSDWIAIEIEGEPAVYEEPHGEVLFGGG